MLASSELLPAEGRVLDLYAGSGALAFEALSRGAGEAVLVEEAPQAVATIRENARALDVLSRTNIVKGDVRRALAKIDGSFELVLVDPPYAEVRAPAFAEVLAAAASKIVAGGALVLEHASADAPPDVFGLTIDRSRRHGDTTLTIYRKTSLP